MSYGLAWALSYHYLAAQHRLQTILMGYSDKQRLLEPFFVLAKIHSTGDASLVEALLALFPSRLP